MNNDTDWKVGCTEYLVALEDKEWGGMLLWNQRMSTQCYREIPKRAGDYKPLKKKPAGFTLEIVHADTKE